MRNVISVVGFVAVAMIVGACTTSSPSAPASSATSIPITDLKSVAGKWEGLGQGPSSGTVLGGHSADWVTLTINQDGTYEARSYREIGVFRGAGTLTLRDNVIQYQSPFSHGVMYLVYDEGGKRVLRLQGQLASGGAVSAELTPAR